MEYNIMKMDDLLSNLIDNVSQTQLDEELKAFRFYAKKLGIRDYNQLWVAISEEDPSYVLQDEIVIPSPVSNREVTMYPSAKILVEKYNGEFYVFATTEEDLTQVFNTMDEFLNGDMPVEDFYNKDEDMEENKSLIDIEECLKLRDRKSNNKYELQSRYLSERFTLAQKGTLAVMLRENVSDEEIYNYMQELHQDEEAMDSLYSIRDPYSAAQADAERDINNNSPLNFDPDHKEEIIQSLMSKENWSQDQAEDYFAYYWEFYENYLKDEYQVDDDFDWSIEE